MGAEQESTGLVDARGVPVPKAIKFEEFSYEHFDVEVAEKGKDVIYHFWPPNDGVEFCQGFAKKLENGFKASLPSDADVRANYTSRDEALVLMQHAQFPIQLDKQSRSGTGLTVPRETYYVRVIAGTSYPLYETFLKQRLFNNIEKAIKET